MIVTRKWLQEFIDISNITTEDICKTLNSIGLEVDSVKQIEIPQKVVIGYVKERKKHPDADKLSVCEVDIGDSTTQIVCGAKNVREGLYVPVATIGCVLGENFKIKKAKLRGVESNGMICSSTELGLAKLNDGILELDDSIGELIVGKELSEYSLINDDIIEIELTANRGDCLSINGVARELATYYNLKINEVEKNLEYNDIGIGQILDINSSSEISASLIYKAVDLREFKLPLLQKLRVGIIDSFSENDVDDVLSYVTHTNGVILNAYNINSLDKKDELALIHLKKDENGFDSIYANEKINTICVDNNKIEDSNENTFVLEASYIDPDVLSKKVFEKKIKTGEVYYKSSRGSEPNISFGMDYLTTTLSNFGAKVFKGNKSFIEDKEKLVLDVSIKKVNSIIGQDVEQATIENILKSLGFEVKDSGNGVLSTQIPLFRHDIKNIADVTEEIVRIIGIDNITPKPLEIKEAKRVNSVSYDLIKKRKIRQKAITNGFYETLTYVFSNRENLEKYGFDVVSEDKDILNPISNELNTFRTTLLLNLVEAAAANQKLGFKSISLFEIGTVFNKDREESSKISFIFSGEKSKEDVTNAGRPENIAFFEFSSKILNSIGKFDVEPLDSIDNEFVHPYQNAKVIIGDKNIGYIAKLHPSVAKEFDLSDTFIAELDFKEIPDSLIKADLYSKFQASKRDLSLVVPKSMEYKEIKTLINSIKNPLIKQFNLVDIYSDEKLGENQSLTLRFVLQSDDKTLEEEDITSVMNSLLENLEEKLNISLR